MASQPYPLFQSALSSTPFPGTMAETSTPTPASSGTEEQQSPYVLPNKQELDARLEKDEAERKERLSFLQQQRDMKLLELQYIRNLKWSKHPDSNKWVRRQRLGLNGAKDTEPPEMMFKRFQMVSHMSNELAQITEQIRMESQLSPYEEARQKQLGESQGELDEALARRRILEQANDMLPDDQKIPPDTIAAISINPTGSIKGRYGDVDPLSQLTRGAELGAKAGVGAGDDPMLPEPLRNITRLGAGQEKKKQDAKNDEDAAPLPVLGLFKQPKDLNAAMHTDFKDMLNTDGYFHMEKYKVPSSMPGLPDQERERKAWSKDEIKQARAAVATRYPGYEKYFPNFVEKGFTDVPNTGADTGQKDLDVQATRARLKALAQAK